MRNHDKYKHEVAINSAAGVGVLFTRTREPFRCIEALKEVAQAAKIPFGIWNVRDGWKKTDTADAVPKADGITDVYKALKRVKDVDGDGSQGWGHGIYVMHAAHHWLAKHPGMIECLRHYVREFSENPSLRLVLVSPEGEMLPEELQHDIPVVDYSLPDKEEIVDIYRYVMDSCAVDGGEAPNVHSSKQINTIVSSASGMTQMEVEVALSKAIVENKTQKSLEWEQVDFLSFNSTILEAKTEVVKQSEVLELMPCVSIKEVGGLENYKEWIRMVASCLTPEAEQAGVDKAKGVVVVGPPGCITGDATVVYRRGKRNSGRGISLQELYRKFNGLPTSTRKWEDGLDTDLHSYCLETGKVQFNRIVKVLEAGEKKVIEIVAVADGGGEYRISLTADHPMINSDGVFQPAGEFVEGNLIRMIGSMKPTGCSGKQKRPSRRVVETLKFYQGQSNMHLVNGCAYQRTNYARLVLEAHMNQVSTDEFIEACRTNPDRAKLFKVLPKGLDVHHIDENPMNDSIGNLMVLSSAEHSRLHGKVENFDVEYTVEHRIKSVKQLSGLRMTYDVQMEVPLNNFVCSGFIVHNTGKTLLGKTTGTVLNRPLVRVDISKCFAGIVGQSEGKARSAIRQLEAMSPVVALIDEVDKALGGAHKGGGDSGVSQRVLGIFLTAMQESKADIFWILTANRVGNLPSEMLRKGRMDEVFAVLPPNRTEREAVFRIHLKKRKVDPDSVEDLDDAIDASKGYVSAEIEAAVKEAKKYSFQKGDPITGRLLCQQLRMMKPISEAFPEDFAEMERWASNNARNASISDTENQHTTTAIKARRRAIN
jgi:SpoVK/Ycf46/Vps4 family AAA+-type ATPase